MLPVISKRYDSWFARDKGALFLNSVSRRTSGNLRRSAPVQAVVS